MSPLRLYGDDAEDHKKQKSLILTWSCTCCHLPTMKSRFLITILPLTDVVTDMTVQVVLEYIAWSMHVLLRGEWPLLDPHGQQWPEGTIHAKSAGLPLDPLHGSRGGLGQFMGDWKFLADVLCLPQNYRRRLCCHWCCAVHHGPGPSFADFAEHPAWENTAYTHTDYMNDVGAQGSPIAGIPGFHLAMVMPDAMHVLHLGFCCGR